MPTAIDPHLWVDDEVVASCTLCQTDFGFFGVAGKHHCRRCGLVFCDECTDTVFPLESATVYGSVTEERVCRSCYKDLCTGCAGNHEVAAAPVPESRAGPNRHWEKPLQGQPRDVLVAATSTKERRKSGDAAENALPDAEDWPAGADMEVMGSPRGLLEAYITGVDSDGLGVLKLEEDEQPQPAALPAKQFGFRGGKVVDPETLEQIERKRRKAEQRMLEQVCRVTDNNGLLLLST